MRPPAITRSGDWPTPGKNFWTIEPTLGLMYFGQKNGIEASVYFGADFNFENPDTRLSAAEPSFMWTARWPSIFRCLGGWPGSG